MCLLTEYRMLSPKLQSWYHSIACNNNASLCMLSICQACPYLCRRILFDKTIRSVSPSFVCASVLHQRHVSVRQFLILVHLFGSHTVPAQVGDKIASLDLLPGLCFSFCLDREPENSQATGRVGSVQKVWVETEAKPKRGSFKAKTEQLSKSCSGQ